MTVHLPYGFATDGGTDTETNDGDAGGRLGAAIDPERDEPVESLTDPTALRARDDVTALENTYTHENPDHCEATAAGRVVVGVTNDDGEALLLVADERDHAMLPNTVVDADEDWARAARSAVADGVDTSVRLDGVESVRTVEHVVEADGDTRHQNTTHHVLFHASPTDADVGGGPAVAQDGWHAGWYDELPVDPAVEDFEDVIADIRMVLE